jgi:hypothetical protein
MQGLLVCLIVLVAAVYAVLNLMPATTRRNLALRAARGLGGPDQSGVRGRIAGALLRSGQAAKGGCIDCPAHWSTPAERASEDKDSRT